MNRIHHLLSDNWAIQRHALTNLMALIMPGLTSGNISGISDYLSRSTCEVQAYNPYLAEYYEVCHADLPNNSVLVFNLSGPLYSWMSESLAWKLRSIYDNPKICGVVLVIDGPGGMVSHIDQAVAAIRDCPKPTAAVVTGCMASAHFWLGTSCDKTYVVSPLCEVGSVGIIFTHANFRDYFKQQGIDYREIYPDTADLKNEEIRALIDKDDDSLIKTKAERVHRIFAEDVAKNLEIGYDPALPLFRGRMFPGDEAVALGYIDEMGTLEDAARWVLGQSVSRKANSIIDDLDN